MAIGFFLSPLTEVVQASKLVDESTAAELARDYESALQDTGKVAGLLDRCQAILDAAEPEAQRNDVAADSP